MVRPRNRQRPVPAAFGQRIPLPGDASAATAASPGHALESWQQLHSASRHDASVADEPPGSRVPPIGPSHQCPGSDPGADPAPTSRGAAPRAHAPGATRSRSGGPAPPRNVRPAARRYSLRPPAPAKNARTAPGIQPFSAVRTTQSAKRSRSEPTQSLNGPSQSCPFKGRVSAKEPDPLFCGVLFQLRKKIVERLLGSPSPFQQMEQTSPHGPRAKMSVAGASFQFPAPPLRG
jgi:hypothetical protein